MYDYEKLYVTLSSRYGKQNGLHEEMRKLNSLAETLSYEEYFARMTQVCKNNLGAYHVYFDKYNAWYDKEGHNIVPR